jgi:hypothetical protein
MEIEAQINGVSVDVLIDSGANRAIMSDELAKQLGLVVTPNPKPLGADGIGGTTVYFVGNTVVNLRIGNTMVNMIIAVAKHSEVFARTSFLAIISYGTLRYFPKMVVDAKNDQIEMGGVVIKIGSARNRGQAFTARVLTPTILQPNTLTKVPIYINGGIPCDGYHVEVNPMMRTEEGYEVMPAVVTAQSGMVPVVLVSNPGMTCVPLYSGMSIGQAMPIFNNGNQGVRMESAQGCIRSARVSYLQSF